MELKRSPRLNCHSRQLRKKSRAAPPPHEIARQYAYLQLPGALTLLRKALTPLGNAVTPLRQAVTQLGNLVTLLRGAVTQPENGVTQAASSVTLLGRRFPRGSRL